MDRLARAGWLSHRPERLDGQLRRAAPCRPEGWYLYHGGDGQFPGQSADEQIAAHALVAARGQSPPPSSLHRLQWYAWFWLRTEILPSQRYATASGDCRLNPPNLRRSRQHVRIIKRLRELEEANRGRSLYVTEVCMALRVNARTLHHICALLSGQFVNKF